MAMGLSFVLFSSFSIARKEKNTNSKIKYCTYLLLYPTKGVLLLPKSASQSRVTKFNWNLFSVLLPIFSLVCFLLEMLGLSHSQDQTWA